jgi:V/A-type H+-transporting ATPase subunit D
MAVKFKLTRPELKRFRDLLGRYTRYLPMLKLKQQQLQVSLRKIAIRQRELRGEIDEAQQRFDSYRAVLVDVAGVAIEELAKPTDVNTGRANVAGVEIPVFEDCQFAAPTYSLFGTPPWVDRALVDLRNVNRIKAELQIVTRQYAVLHEELTRIVQRVNLFEKIKIPEAQEAIRVIRIKLGDEMTAAVGRAKIAKSKITESEDADAARSRTADAQEMAAEEEAGSL